ncbi:MAG: galactokinase [Oligoflexia bacterium]|nr:galactokinase [Oligoflexia bacterium]
MLITRSPLRITLGGGGTDLPSYYENYEGFLVSAAIDKYVYITIHKTFQPEYIIKYSKYEKVNSLAEIQHPIIREAMKTYHTSNEFVEITSMADIPAGTGLGSSGSFTAALIKGICTYQRVLVDPYSLAEASCDIELNKLKEPIGKQDQYIASFGGLTTFHFKKDGKVDVSPLKISDEALYNLEDHLLLFFTGQSRKASSILRDQDDKTKESNSKMIENLHFVKELGIESKRCLENDDLEQFARLMNIHWNYKKERSPSMTNSEIDYCYDFALKNGALGGKLIGAGGGGFLMFYAHDPIKLREAMKKALMREVRFRFDFEGTKVLS